MEATAKAQRRRAFRQATDSSVIRVEMRDGLGNPRWVTADLLDITDGGFGLSLRTPLKSGFTVVVRGKLAENRPQDNLKVGVRWCLENADGTFRAGLEFLDGKSSFDPSAEEPEAAAPVNPDALDCYEVLQLSPNADPDTISRVFRLLALRYHPDNTETGSTEIFVRLTEAYEILSDPAKRAKYDTQHRDTKRLRWKIFDQASASVGVEGEQRKRQGILSLLHAKMLFDPEQAGMNIQLIEELLGCPREHLQAAIWYLKAKNYIKRSDNGRFSITIAGFDEAETQQLKPGRTGLQLTAAKPAN